MNTITYFRNFITKIKVNYKVKGYKELFVKNRR